MRKLEDDEIGYFDNETVNVLCSCGSEIELRANEEDVCPMCGKEYVSKISVAVYELEEGDENVEIDENEESD